MPGSGTGGTGLEGLGCSQQPTANGQLLSTASGCSVYLFGAFLLVIFVIEKIKDNKLQGWLARCHFGNGEDKYDTADKQVAEYKLALG
jgi:hypothetical protein